MELISLGLFLTLVIAGVWVLNQSRVQAIVADATCPRCSKDLQPLSPTPEIKPWRAWEIMACESCSFCVSLVQGVPSSATWCPACKSRSMEITLQRQPAEPGTPLAVEVHEQCHLCNHTADIHTQSRDERHGGKVLQFPGRGA